MSAVALGRGASHAPRPCEFAGWVLVDAASSMAIALLHVLVVDVLNVCNLLCICGAMLHSIPQAPMLLARRHWCLQP